MKTKKNFMWFIILLLTLFCVTNCQEIEPIPEPTKEPALAQKVLSSNYYVSSKGKTNEFDKLYGTYLGNTIKSIKGKTFSSGDTVRFYGTLTDDIIGNPGKGTKARPIVFIGVGPKSGRAVIQGITLSKCSHVVFQNFESASNIIQIRIVNSSKDSVNFIKFKNCYLHNGIQGVAITIPTATDIRFEGTTIDKMDQDGILLSDAAGDRFSFVNGSITNTGLVYPGWNTHGCYASGGTGHVFDGGKFSNNANGASISVRRGGMTIRNCSFFNTTKAVSYNNEDEASGVNYYTGSRAKNQYISLYRNLFVDCKVAIYLGYHLANNNGDRGCENPGNAWAVFNNTFVNTQVNFGKTSDNNGEPKFYDIFIRNNAFVNTKVIINDAVTGRKHELSNNGWYNSTFVGGNTPQGSGITANPQLDGNYRVTNAAYKNAGIKDIAPANAGRDMAGITMVANDQTNPLFFYGSNPDIGREEYKQDPPANKIPVAEITSISPYPPQVGVDITFKGKGTDSDGTIVGYEWKSNVSGVFGTSATTVYSGLSAGPHTISFRVKDNSGAWSKAAIKELVVGNNNTSPELVGRWKFDEKTGLTAADSSPNKNNGTFSKGGAWDTGKFGNAAVFNNCHITVPGSASLNAISTGITLSVWVKAKAPQNKSAVIERYYYNSSGTAKRSFILYIDKTGTIAFGINNNGKDNVKWLTTSERISWDTWAHIAATFDGSTMKLYINGQKKNEVATTFSTIYKTSADTHFGGWYYNSTWDCQYNGLMDDARIYNGALSAESIFKIYQGKS